MLRLVHFLTIVCLLSSPCLAADDPVFSGPQIDEKLPDFKVKKIRGDEAGQEYSVLEQAEKKPVLLIFWHQLGRPSYGLINAITKYTGKHTKELDTSLIILSDDLQADRFGNVIERMPKDLHVVVPSAGKEGPGSYGLNRNVRMTVVVGKEGKVTGNFALIQPSVQADWPKITSAVAKAIGKPAPNLEDMDLGMRMARNKRGAARQMGQTDRAAQGRGDPKLIALLRPLLQKDASEEDIDKAAKALIEYAKTDKLLLKDVGERTSRIVKSGKLSTYGTKATQEYFRKWAKEYGPKKLAGRK